MMASLTTGDDSSICFTGNSSSPVAGRGIPAVKGDRPRYVASDIAPHLEVLGADGLGHHLVHQGDIEALSTAMSQALTHSAEERRGAEALAADAARRYSWDAVTSATELVYAGVLGLAPELAPPFEWAATGTGSESSAAAPGEDLAGMASRLK